MKASRCIGSVHGPVRAFALTAALLAGCVIIGCAKETSTPPRVDSTVQMPEKDSTIVVPISINLAQLQTKLNAQVPTRIYSIDEDRDACIPKQTAKVCLLPHPEISLFGHKVQDASCGQWVESDVSPAIDCHLTGAVDRKDIQLSAAGNVITASVPLAAWVTARGRGELGKNVQVTANGAMELTARITADVTPDWQPQLTLDPSYTWTTPPNFHILGIEVTIADKVDPALRSAMDQFKSVLQQRVQDLNLHSLAEEVWKKAFEPLAVSQNPDIWVRFTPREVGFSGISSDAQSLNLTLMAAGITESFVGTKPTPSPLTPLPTLRKDLPAAAFAFYLPIYADYGAATETLKKLLRVGEQQEFDVPAIGATRVTFTDVTLYPTTGNAMAIGISMEAKPPQGWFATTGTAWATGKIKVDSAAEKLEADELSFGAATDNSATNLLVSIARADPIRKKIETALTYDFSKEYTSALQKANAALNRPLVDNLNLSGAITQASVDQITTSERGVYMGMHILGNVRIEAAGNLGEPAKN